MPRIRKGTLIGAEVEIVMSEESVRESGIRSLRGRVTRVLKSTPKRLPFFEVHLTAPPYQDGAKNREAHEPSDDLEIVAVQAVNYGFEPERLTSSESKEVMVDVVRLRSGTVKEMPTLARAANLDYLGYGKMRLWRSEGD
jgi:hypothetical protein